MAMRLKTDFNIHLTSLTRLCSLIFMKYSIYEAKARFSEIIRMVKARRCVIISERGVPVAEIIPYEKGQQEKLADRIARLIKSGSILSKKDAFRFESLANRPGAVNRFLQQDRD
jgi:prevent-host-death family protein